MFKKGIISIASVGLLAFTLSAGIVKADGNDYSMAKKAIERQVEKPLEKGMVNSQILNQLEGEIKDSNPFNAKSFSTMGTMSSSFLNSEFLFEKEVNDDFHLSNGLSYKKPTVGQLLPLYDLDYLRVVVPKDGLLLVGGGTNSYAIELLFAAFQKDYAFNSKLEYVGTEYQDDIEIQGYQAKAGTYYVVVMDNDYYDDNTEEDLYAIATEFVDNVKPNKPIVNKVDDNDAKVTGKAEAGTTVIVKTGSKTIGYSKADTKGNFSVKIKAQKKGTRLAVNAKDKAGNVSSTRTVTVVKH